MLPRMPMNDATYLTFANRELFGECALGHALRGLFSNLRDLWRCQHRRPRTFSNSVILSSLRDAVLRVVFRCAQKKVARIYAKRIVASVQDKFGRVKIAVRERVRKAGYCDALSKVVHVRITLGRYRTFPRPAFIWPTNIDVAPKPFGGVAPRLHVSGEGWHRHTVYANCAKEAR